MLKGQCVGIEAMQSRVIAESQPVKSLLNVVLQEFSKFIVIINGGRIARSETSMA